MISVHTIRAALFILPLLTSAAVAADSPPPPETWAVHGQSTLLWQYHPGFHTKGPTGPQSLDTGRRGNETFDATLFLGYSPWRGGEFWLNPEVYQGFGLQNTTGAAGYFNGEAYKVERATPFYRITRGFFRQTFSLGGKTETVAPDQNVLGGTRDSNRIVVTVGKYAVTDIFDTNKYAHDPRVDFMNWSLIDSGAFDFAADSWGYTYGAAAEWVQDWWTLRAGLFDLSTLSNARSIYLRPGHQVEAVIEAEERHTLFGQPGKLKLLLYLNRGLMVRLSDFTRAPAGTGMASLRHLRTRMGGALNLEQSLTADLGMFVRLSLSDGRYETLGFTDIDRSAAIGLALTGSRWNRADDVGGAAFVFNEASRDRLNFFRAGGQGALVGDGAGAPGNAGGEQIFETYYSLAVVKWANVTIDYQLANHPAYNADRGPVHVFGLRLHAQF